MRDILSGMQIVTFNIDMDMSFDDKAYSALYTSRGLLGPSIIGNAMIGMILAIFTLSLGMLFIFMMNKSCKKNYKYLSLIKFILFMNFIPLVFYSTVNINRIPETELEYASFILA